MGDAFEVGGFEGFELEDPAAREQGAVDREIGVFGGGADEDDGAVFDPGQQRVLLGFVKAVNFVYK